MGIIHFILMMGTLALTYEYYDNLAYEIPKIVHTIVYVGVIGVSVVWALAHALFGAAMSIGRLWVYVLTFSAGAFLCHAETWVIVASALVGFICLAINNLVKFFWGNTSSGI
jgi:hypothetical protein